MKKLILITSQFPYFFGEPFLINELPYICKNFKEIYIFSINGSSNVKFTRDIPSNAKCFPLGNTISKIKYIQYILKGMFYKNSELRIQQYSLKRLIASLYVRGRAKTISTQIYRCIKAEGIQLDDVVVYSFWFSYQAAAAYLLSKDLKKHGSKVITISRAHGYDLYWERVLTGYHPFQDVLLKEITCFPCSNHGRDYLTEKYPWAKDKVITARLGTRDYGLNPYKARRTLVTCCNLEKLKRMSLFAEAFCIAAKEETDLKWICIGDGAEREIIEKTISCAKCKSHVEIKGRLSNEEVLKIYQDEEVMYFCNISTTEGIPVSIMEAMSFGIPIIATDVGGTSELVDESNGILISSELDKISLSKIILNMIKMDRKSHFAMRNMSRKKWEEDSSADRNYSLFCSTINCL